MKKIRTALAVGALTLAATAGTAAGAPPVGAGDGGKPAGVAGQQAGISTLESRSLLSAVAAGGIEVVGVGTVPFNDVLRSIAPCRSCSRPRA
jgi:hypothetical protein